MRQARFFRDVGKGTVVIIVIEMARRPFARSIAFQLRSVHDENVRPPIVVVIENRNSSAGGFDDVLFCRFSTENDGRSESGLCGNVRKVRDWCGGLGLCLRRTLRCRSGELHREPGAKAQQKKPPERRKMVSHQALRIVS